MDTNVVGWLSCVLVVAFVFGFIPWMVRRRARQQEKHLYYMLAAVATMADAHRQTCRALIALGRHSECPVCHVDEALWEEVVLPIHRSMHIVSLAKHQSWLDPDVAIARIVSDKYRDTQGGRHP